MVSFQTNPGKPFPLVCVNQFCGEPRALQSGDFTDLHDITGVMASA